MDFSGVVLDGRYRLVRLLGKGGMGRVYEAEHLGLGGKIAVKVLGTQFAKDPKFRERFRREARSTSRIRHPNIVQILDFGETPDGSVYFAMEFLEGRDLQSILAKGGGLPWTRVQHLLAQVADALSAAHLKGVVHRDIKPANLFVLESEAVRDFVKVLDFGIAKILASPNEESVFGKKLTATGEVFGTVTYMAPEQAYGDSDDPRVDIYSLGVVAYEALTGSAPFKGGSSFEILTRHVYEAPVPPRQRVPSLPLAMEQVVLRALAKKAEDRFASMEEFGRALRAVTDEKGASDGSAQPRRHSRTEEAPSAVSLDTNAPTAPKVVGSPSPVRARPALAPGVPAPLHDRGSGPGHGGSWPEPPRVGSHALTPSGGAGAAGSSTSRSKRLPPSHSQSSTGPVGQLASSRREETQPERAFGHVTTGAAPPGLWVLGVVLALVVGTVSAFGVVAMLDSDEASGVAGAETPAVADSLSASPGASAATPSGDDAQNEPSASPPDPIPAGDEDALEIIDQGDMTATGEGNDAEAESLLEEAKQPSETERTTGSTSSTSEKPLTDSRIKSSLTSKIKRECRSDGNGKRVSVELLIGSDGTVLRCRVEGATQSLSSCIERVVGQPGFPPGNVHTVTISTTIGKRKDIDCNNPFLASKPQCKGR